VYAAKSGIHIDDLLVFGGGFLPPALGFESFGVELVDLVGEGSFTNEVLGCAKREIGESVGGGVENIGIAGKVAIEDDEEIERIVRGVVRHGAIQAEEADALFEIAVSDLMDGFFQEWEGFGTVAGFRERHGVLWILLLLGSGSRSFGRHLSIRGRKEEE
jgi:hypothetical protein